MTFALRGRFGRLIELLRRRLNSTRRRANVVGPLRLRCRLSLLLLLRRLLWRRRLLLGLLLHVLYMRTDRRRALPLRLLRRVVNQCRGRLLYARNRRSRLTLCT